MSIRHEAGPARKVVTMPVTTVHLLAEDRPALRHRAGRLPATPLSALLHGGPRDRGAGSHRSGGSPRRPDGWSEGTACASLFVHDPLVSASGQFALAARAGRVEPEGPSSAGERPWGLRRMGPVSTIVRLAPAGRYDPLRQLSLDTAGIPIVAALRAGGPVTGPPTAPTTATVDGEDPPSSEDYNNDYCPDEPDAA